LVVLRKLTALAGMPVFFLELGRTGMDTLTAMTFSDKLRWLLTSLRPGQTGMQLGYSCLIMPQVIKNRLRMLSLLARCLKVLVQPGEVTKMAPRCALGSTL
jgi:hypothetical protein